MKKWLIFIASCIGLIALCVLIWLVFPIIAFGDVRPFASVWLRLALVMLCITIFSGVYAWRYYRKRKASAALAKAIATPASGEADSDAKQLAEKMADAVQTLKGASKAKGDFLYELPWYIIIGPPGAGKTTALLNSGLKFPLASSKEKRPIAGVGGTRYCDWWFTEEAVLIDTAGRYTTQDSDAASDRKSWLSFLDLLKKNRPLQPINGVMVAISLADIMSLPEPEISSHCAAIRKRLTELHEHLRIDYPVYVMFTKADMVAGFTEYFNTLGEQRRRMVWGATFKVKNKSENKVTEVGPEFELLIDRLSQELPDRLQEEGDPVSRARIFGFPSQMAALGPSISGFLNQIFEPTRYQTNIPLRGFYFTSGTQEGTPIDRLLGAMQGMLGSSPMQPAMSGRGKSFFLGDLLTKVIFGEAGWVSTNRAAQQRKAVGAYLGYGAVGLVSLVLLGLWGLSYYYNSQLIAATDRGVVEYQAVASPVIQEDPVADADFTRPLDLLDMLVNLPAGYATRDVAEEPIGTMGLSQKPRLLSAATASYRIALDRTLRSRLLLHVEKQIEANQNSPLFLYEALKVYLMLGRYPGAPIDENFILNWMKDQWDTTVSRGNTAARDQFLAHISAMLALDTEGGVDVPMNGPLVEDSQRIIARMSLADRAYLFLKSEAQADETPDWTAAEAGGPDVKTVFETVDGSELDTIVVSKFFTYYGFNDLFLAKFGDVYEQINSEQWVLGKLGQEAVIASQLRSAGPALLDKYAGEFIKEWEAALAKLRLKSLARDKTNYAILEAISGPTSPLEAIIQSVSAQTRLTAEPPESLAPASGEDQATSIAGVAAKVIATKLESKLTGMARMGLQIAKKSELRAGGTSAKSSVPGLEVETHFREFHNMVDGDPGQQPIDQVVANLKGVYENLVAAKTEADPAVKGSDLQNVQQFISAIRTQNANRLPAPFSKMITDAANEFEGDAANTSIAELNAELQNNVSRKCEEVINNRYPFALKSKRDVPWIEFGNLFGQSGTIDQFFATKLAPLVDQSGPVWKWKPNTRLGRELSPAALKAFQNADKIRQAYFPFGGKQPNVPLTVTPQTLSELATGVEFELNGTKLETLPQLLKPQEFSWPGSGGMTDGSASITMLPNDDGTSVLAEKGAWALMKLFARGGMRPAGDAFKVTYVIGGKDVSYLVRVGSLANPFALPALAQFTCPKTL